MLVVGVIWPPRTKGTIDTGFSQLNSQWQLGQVIFNCYTSHVVVLNNLDLGL
jgi:hypothetical protein